MRGGFFNCFGGLGVEDSICFWPGFFLVVTPSCQVLPFPLSGGVSAVTLGVIGGASCCGARYSGTGLGDDLLLGLAGIFMSSSSSTTVIGVVWTLAVP